MAKSTKFNKTDIKKKEFVKAYMKSFGNITVTCRAIDIDRGTYYNWIRDDENFKRELENAEPKEVYKDFIEAKLQKLMQDDNPAAIIFASKTICKDRGYIERTEQSHDVTEEFAKTILNVFPQKKDLKE